MNIITNTSFLPAGQRDETLLPDVEALLKEKDKKAFAKKATDLKQKFSTSTLKVKTTVLEKLIVEAKNLQTANEKECLDQATTLFASSMSPSEQKKFIKLMDATPMSQKFKEIALANFSYLTFND